MDGRDPRRSDLWAWIGQFAEELPDKAGLTHLWNE